MVLNGPERPIHPDDSVETEIVTGVGVTISVRKFRSQDDADNDKPYEKVTDYPDGRREIEEYD